METQSREKKTLLRRRDLVSGSVLVSQATFGSPGMVPAQTLFLLKNGYMNIQHRGSTCLPRSDLEKEGTAYRCFQLHKSKSLISGPVRLKRLI